MDSRMHFTFSDTIAGSVVAYQADEDTFTLRTIDGREFEVAITNQTFAEVIRNLGEAYIDATGQMREMLDRGRILFAYGIFYPEGGEHRLRGEAHRLRRPHARRTSSSSAPSGGSQQVARDRGLLQQRAVAGRQHRLLRLPHADHASRATSCRARARRRTRSRASSTASRRAYLLTGEDRFLEVAEKGTEYLRDHMRTVDAAEGIAYWVHGDRHRRRQGEEDPRLRVRRRLRRDPGLRADLRARRPDADVPRHGRPADPERHRADASSSSTASSSTARASGFFSHIDPITFDPRSETLGVNQARKNWNSVGDHAPAFLINAWLATGNDAVRRLPRSTRPTRSCNHFPDYEKSPFVNERFHEDWTPDHSYKWQHNRAVVGHNLKIAWNLMRINSVRPSNKYVELARKIAEIMPPIGSDRQRGGWYDVMEREKGDGPGVVPLHLARPEGVVAAGAGDPRLPDPRRHPRRRGVPHRGALRGRVLQRVVPRPRRGRRLLQRARERHAVPARHRAAQGQPLDVGLPQHRALLPGGGLHEPADHEAAARPALQAARRRVEGPHPPRLARHPPARLDQDRARCGSTASRGRSSTPTS